MVLPTRSWQPERIAKTPSDFHDFTAYSFRHTISQSIICGGSRIGKTETHYLIASWICNGHRCINLGSIARGGSSRSRSVALFKRRRFPVEIILLCVRWYCKYGISYRDLAEMMSERGISVDPSTIFRWVQRYAPEIEKRIRPYQGPRSGSWRVDETYVRVGGKWKYLFRAVDKHGRLIASMLSDRRDTGRRLSLLAQSPKGNERLSAILHHDR